MILKYILMIRFKPIYIIINNILQKIASGTLLQSAFGLTIGISHCITMPQLPSAAVKHRHLRFRGLYYLVSCWVVPCCFLANHFEKKETKKENIHFVQSISPQTFSLRVFTKLFSLSKKRGLRFLRWLTSADIPLLLCGFIKDLLEIP